MRRGRSNLLLVIPARFLLVITAKAWIQFDLDPVRPPGSRPTRHDQSNFAIRVRFPPPRASYSFVGQRCEPLAGNGPQAVGASFSNLAWLAGPTHDRVDNHVTS